MKLALIYSDKRAKYLCQGLSNHCDIVEYDLSSVTIKLWQKFLSALISFHLNKKFWQNDFYRNPLAVYFRRTSGEALIKKNITPIDAVLQFGVTTPYKLNDLFGKASFYIYHDGAYDPNNPNWFCPRYGKWFGNMQKNIFNSAKMIFTFSQWSCKQHINQYSQNKNKVVNVGWGPCLPLKRDFVKVREKANKFIFIGNDFWVKGIDILLLAFSILIKSHPHVRLDIIGINKNELLYNAIPNGVRILGSLSSHAVVDMLSKSDVLILPSRLERAGHVTVEAMWYGLPTIVSDIFGSPEPIRSGNCGIVVRPESIDDLVKAMNTLTTNPGFVKRMSENATAEAQENWTWNKVGSRIVKLIEASLN